MKESSARSGPDQPVHGGRQHEGANGAEGANGMDGAALTAGAMTGFDWFRRAFQDPANGGWRYYLSKEDWKAVLRLRPILPVVVFWVSFEDVGGTTTQLGRSRYKLRTA